jgi:hypothetical protein
MRVAALLTLGCLLLLPAQSLANPSPDPSEVVEDQADAVEVQPVVEAVPDVTTRNLDPPTSVEPFSDVTPVATEETRAPLDISSDPPQPLPPGPPNRRP